MDIQTKKLIHFDVYYYDITACHYQVLKGLGIDMQDIPYDNKLERNTKIGLLMRDNPRVSKILRDSTNSTISSYLQINCLKEEDVLLRAYDGFITTKYLKSIELNLIPISIQSVFDVMIISSDKKSYIAKTSDSYVIKGVSHRYPMIDEVISKLLTINFMSKECIFKKLQKIKDDFLNCQDTKMFLIPTNDDFSMIHFKEYGETVIGNSLAPIMDSQDIDKLKYFDYYLRPFTESITLEFL